MARSLRQTELGLDGKLYFRSTSRTKIEEAEEGPTKLSRATTSRVVGDQSEPFGHSARSNSSSLINCTPADDTAPLGVAYLALLLSGSLCLYFVEPFSNKRTMLEQWHTKLGPSHLGRMGFVFERTLTSHQ